MGSWSVDPQRRSHFRARMSPNPAHSGSKGMHADIDSCHCVNVRTTNCTSGRIEKMLASAIVKANLPPKISPSAPPPPAPASSNQLTARIPGRFIWFFLLCLFELCGCFCVVFDSMLCACHVSDSMLCFGCGIQQCVPVPMVLDIFMSFCVFALFCISFRCFLLLLHGFMNQIGWKPVPLKRRALDTSTSHHTDRRHVRRQALRCLRVSLRSRGDDGAT